MVRRTDGKWWTDKAPQFRFDTMDLAEEFDARTPAEVPKVAESLKSIPGKVAPRSIRK